jgi:hypothetical protein
MIVKDENAARRYRPIFGPSIIDAVSFLGFRFRKSTSLRITSLAPFGMLSLMLVSMSENLHPWLITSNLVGRVALIILLTALAGLVAATLLEELARLVFAEWVRERITRDMTLLPWTRWAVFLFAALIIISALLLLRSIHKS